jgi:hypothetical protein
MKISSLNLQHFQILIFLFYSSHKIKHNLSELICWLKEKILNVIDMAGSLSVNLITF